MKKILLYGIGSYKNRGVEAIVQSALNQLPKDTKIDVASYDINYNKTKYKDKVNKYINHRITYEELPLETRLKINEFAKDNNYFDIENIYQKEVIKELPNYDICISAGGDNYCYDANDWLFTMDRSIKLNNKKLVLFGASLYEKIENEDLIRDLDFFDVLSIRESVSYNELKKYISEDKLLLTPDTAFSLKPEKVKLDDWYKNREVIGLNISPTVIGKNNNRLKDIIKLVEYILNNTKYSVSLISHVTIEESNDYEVLKSIFEQFKNSDRIFLERDDYNCNQIKYVISKCKLIIAARTHASIAAYSSCIPTLVLGYSVKSKGIATDLFGTSKNYVIPFDELNIDNLIDKLNWLIKNKSAIKKRLNEIIPTMKKESLKAFNKIINKLEEQEKEIICDPKDCINCNICKEKCPVDAIETIETDLHFKYNKRNVDKCINCGMCLNICPAINKNKKDKFKIISYAAKNKNIEVQKQSTSGGVFTALAEYIINKKGIVYGAQRINNKTSHIRITNKKEISKIRGSKYSYSSLNNILKPILDDVKNNKLILFSGTPCQVSAIKKLIGEYKKIYYVSVICHGVINDKLVDDYCNQENVKLLSYKTKENGWSKSSVKYDKYTKRLMNDSLLALYINNYILRESCYQCKYKLDNNLSDIILGDYFGIQNIDKNMFDDNGVSHVIINSNKGKELFDIIKNNLIYKKTSIDNINKTNPCLIKSPIKPVERFTIDEDLKHNTWENIYKLSMNKTKIVELNKEIDRLNNVLSKNTEELNSIKNSKRWKMINKIANRIKSVKK